MTVVGDYIAIYSIFNAYYTMNVLSKDYLNASNALWKNPGIPCDPSYRGTVDDDNSAYIYPLIYS